MRIVVAAAFLALALSGCVYAPEPRELVRLNSSPADIRNCRRLGGVGEARTDEEGWIVRADGRPVTRPSDAPLPRLRGRTPVPGEDFGERLDLMTDAAIRLGATDLLLSRRRLRDWSYVEGVAYRCRR